MSISHTRSFCPKTQNAAVIWLHGLGDTGAGWSDLPRILPKDLNHIHWTFPTAPTRPVSMNMGYEMPAWFDTFDSPKTIHSKDDMDGMLKSVQFVHDIARERLSQGVSAERIFFGGFSQGGSISILAGLMFDQSIGGVISFSGYVPLRNSLPKLIKQPNCLEYLICHGKEDDRVPFSLGELASDTVQGHGHSVTFHSYEGLTHSACDEEFHDLANWLRKRL